MAWLGGTCWFVLEGEQPMEAHTPQQQAAAFVPMAIPMAVGDVVVGTPVQIVR